MKTMKLTTMKLKRRLALFVALIMALTLWTALPLQASADGTVNDFTYELVIPEDGGQTTATITGYTGSETELNIPNSITENGSTYKVTEIAVGAFGSNTNVTSIFIPRNVTTTPVTYKTFPASLESITVDGDNEYLCSEEGVLFNRDQTTIVCYPASKSDRNTYTIPHSVTSIGNDAFLSNTSLITIVIPVSVISIGVSAFNGCTSLVNVDIPESVTTINRYAFHGTAITTVTIPADITFLESDTFSECAELTTVIIEPGVTSILPKMFLDCDNLTSVTIPSSVTSLGYRAFSNCLELTEIDIPGDITDIPSGLFEGCTKLTKFLIPPTVTSIGTGAFKNTGFTELAIPSGVETIGSYAFEGTPLTSIVIPASVTAIGENPFWKCTEIIDVTVPATVLSRGLNSVFPNSTITTVAIVDGVTEIPVRAFKGYSSLTSITIPNTVTSIGSEAFHGTGLTSLTIPEDVTVIPAGMVNSCASLSEVTIPDTVTSIGVGAFGNCPLLTGITIPNSVKTIENYAFNNSGLTSITIPESMESIGTNVFQGCTLLTKVMVLSSDTTFGNNAFYNISSNAKIWCYAGSSAQTDPVFNGKTKILMLKSIALNSDELALRVNDTANLVVSYTPADPADSSQVTETYYPVTWTSSNASVAAVGSGSGTITAKAYGTAIITATVEAESGDKIATCEVTVAKPASITSFTLADAAGVITDDPDNATLGTIEVTVPAGTTLTGLTPVIVHNGASVDVTGSQDFSNFQAPIVYTVTDGGTTRAYTIIIKLTYDVTVTGGTGASSYTAGTEVTITADDPADGKAFDAWTTSDGVDFTDANSAQTTFVMPASAVTITATYKDVFTVTVVNGTDNTNAGPYAAGTEVSVTASTAMRISLEKKNLSGYSNASRAKSKQIL